jgi:hypothetical protein
MELEEDDRAIWAWEGRLETRALDPEALDGLVFLFEKAERYRPLIDVLNKRAKLDARDPVGDSSLVDQRRADRVRVATILSERLDATEEAIDTWNDVEGTFGESDDGTRALAALFKATRRWQELASLLSRPSLHVQPSVRRRPLTRPRSCASSATCSASSSSNSRLRSGATKHR